MGKWQKKCPEKKKKNGVLVARWDQLGLARTTGRRQELLEQCRATGTVSHFNTLRSGQAGPTAECDV